MLIKKNISRNQPLGEIVNIFKKSMGDSLTSLVLFGSYARGDATPSSDYDILLVASHLPPKGMMRYKHIRELIKGYLLLPVAFIPKTEEEIDKDITPLLMDIALDGKILFDNGFISERLNRLKNIIKMKGLSRKKIGKNYLWKWKSPPSHGKWEINWNDFRRTD